MGYGNTCDAHHITAPHPEAKGAIRAFQLALEEAGIENLENEVIYINAHGTSTPLNDKTETLAIKSALGEEIARKAYISSTKSMTGHEMWMAGASEVVYSMLMMRHGFIAPNINFTEGDEATSKLNIPVRRVDTEFDCFLSNSFGFGGTNSTLIVKKYK